MATNGTQEIAFSDSETLYMFNSVGQAYNVNMNETIESLEFTSR